jgi:ribosomal protein L30E
MNTINIFDQNVKNRQESLVKIVNMLSSLPIKQFLDTPMLQLSTDFEIRSELSITSFVDDNLSMLKWVIIEESPEDTDIDVSIVYQKTLDEIMSILTYSPAFPRGPPPGDDLPPPFLPSTLGGGEPISHRENVLKWFLRESESVVGRLDTLNLVFQYYAHYLSEESWINNPTDATTLAWHNTYWEKSYDLARQIHPDILESIRLDFDFSHRTLAVDGSTYFHVSDFLVALENGPRTRLIETHGRIMQDVGTPDSIRVQIHSFYDFHEGTYLDLLSMLDSLVEVGRLRTVSQLLEDTSVFTVHETMVHDLSIQTSNLFPVGLLQIARGRLNTIRNILYEDVFSLYGEFTESNKSILSMITNRLGLSPVIQEIMEMNLSVVSSDGEDRTVQLVDSFSVLLTAYAETTNGTLSAAAEAMLASSQAAVMSFQSAVMELGTLVESNTSSETLSVLVTESNAATLEAVEALTSRIEDVIIGSNTSSETVREFSSAVTQANVSTMATFDAITSLSSLLTESNVATFQAVETMSSRIGDVIIGAKITSEAVEEFSTITGTISSEVTQANASSSATFNAITSLSALTQSLSSLVTEAMTKFNTGQSGGTDDSTSISLLTTMVDSTSKTNKVITITILVLVSVIFLGVFTYLVMKQLRKPS